MDKVIGELDHSKAMEDSEQDLSVSTVISAFSLKDSLDSACLPVYNHCMPDTLTPKEPEVTPSIPPKAGKASPKLFKNKKILIIIGVVVLAIIGAAVFWLLTHDTGKDPDKAVDTKGYTFLSMDKCNTDFKSKGYGPGPVNTACMKLEKDLISVQAAGSSDFTPMPLECNSPPDTQWYRTDETLIVDYTDPNTMYVNVEWKGIYKTTNGGKTWALKVKGIAVDHKDIHTGKPCYGEYPVALMDPTNHKRILLATSGGGGGTINDINMRGSGVYETTDGAESWHQTINDKMNGQVNSLALDPKNPQIFYYGSSSGPASYTEADPNKIWITTGLIYKTPDNGKTWEELPTGFLKGTRLTDINIDPRNSQNITAQTISITRNAHGPNAINDEQMGIIKSTDGGQTWKRIDNLPKGHDAGFRLEVNPTNPDQMHFVSSVQDSKTKGFYSTNGGVTWTESPMAMDLFRYDPSGRLIGHQWQATNATTGKLLYQSMDNGKTWTTFGTLPTEIKDFNDKKTRIINIVFHPTDKNTFYLTGANAYVWKTTDNGQTYTTLLKLDMLER